MLVKDTKYEKSRRRWYVLGGLADVDHMLHTFLGEVRGAIEREMLIEETG